MKLKTIIAGSALAVAGVTGAVTQPASAGCGVSITSHNLESGTATVNWNLSKVRTSTVVFGQRVNGTWKSIGNYSTNVSSGAQVVKAFTLDLGCNIDRQYKLYVSEGGNSWYEYFPSSSTWTRDITPHIDLDR